MSESACKTAPAGVVHLSCITFSRQIHCAGCCSRRFTQEVAELCGKEAWLKKFLFFMLCEKEHDMPVRLFDRRDNFTVSCATIAQTTAAPLQSLTALISPPLQQKFSKKLFGGDAAACEKLLTRLETAPNWPSAHRVMEKYFYQRQISPYNNEATRFSDLVYKRYFPLG